MLPSGELIFPQRECEAIVDGIARRKSDLHHLEQAWPYFRFERYRREDRAKINELEDWERIYTEAMDLGAKIFAGEYPSQDPEMENLDALLASINGMRVEDSFRSSPPHAFTEYLYGSFEDPRIDAIAERFRDHIAGLSERDEARYGNFVRNRSRGGKTL